MSAKKELKKEISGNLWKKKIYIETRRDLFDKIKKARKLIDDSPSRMFVEKKRDDLCFTVHRAFHTKPCIESTREMTECIRKMDDEMTELEKAVEDLHAMEKCNLTNLEKETFGYLRVKYTISIECDCGKTFAAVPKEYPYPYPEVGFRFSRLEIVDRSIDIEPKCPSCKKTVVLRNN